MNRQVLIGSIVLVAARVAAADPAPAPEPARPAVSPWGSSPFVVEYVPAQESPAARPHHGMTFEIAMGAGSSNVENNVPAVTLAIGGWLNPRLALAFRASSVGVLQFAGGSAQVVLTPNLWLGAGAGTFSELPMDDTRAERADGVGGFGRIGYQLAGDRHVLYVEAEIQTGAIEDRQRTLGLLAFGYQLL